MFYNTIVIIIIIIILLLLLLIDYKNKIFIKLID